jgi:hypothetical protein
MDGPRAYRLAGKRRQCRPVRRRDVDAPSVPAVGDRRDKGPNGRRQSERPRRFACLVARTIKSVFARA